MAQIDWLEQQQTPQLSDGFPTRMVLLDCETTGGRSSYHRIIEIGLVVIENGQQVDRWQTFINPERAVPAGITRLTGITSTMVKEAPVFAEVIDKLLEILDDRVLVAHHARFDYGFLKMEFERAGIKFNTKPLCSVKLSRMLYPNYKRHGLDYIIKRFNINITNRHRALDDAIAIQAFFIKTSQIHTVEEIKAACDRLLKEHTLPIKINQQHIDALPKTSGVYYFYDEQGKLLYVGKSVNIRQRVLSHFSQDFKNHKDLKMSPLIAQIDYTQTASDFGAQILESQQVKSLKPLFNSRLKRVRKLYRIKTQLHQEGYIYPQINMIEVDDSDHIVQDFYGLFRSKRKAQIKLQNLADKYFLCHKLLRIESGTIKQGQPCFRHQLNKCLGVCCGKETIATHDERLLKALQKYHQKVWPYPGPVLVEERQAEDDNLQTFHWVDQWLYQGTIESEEELYDRGFTINPNPVEISHEQTMAKEITGDFDLDIYFILVRFLLDAEKLSVNNIKIHHLQAAESTY
ncbi:exonuclease domain-containing protein [Marinicella sp. S1101]|uniref:exonuclease domain-containing protein n=1 Tax=Marinicella marina TaxID=2996016 RepID=UPI002260934F|nr:exonuclease domain-containing protein [Marinicella marina]MCX7553397.1 exonuclease domain-containing protein [Marinicella marina]MDJ1140020.1 exonuclease domain-containing protein [Marinicella marina]